MKGSGGGQKSGTFAPGCNGGWGGADVGVEVDVMVEELAD
jgi:hypothetical protein